METMKTVFAFFKNKVFILMLMFCVISPLTAMKRYFYKNIAQSGSEAQFNPLYTYVNGGFDILRNGFVPRKIQKIQFRNGFDLLNESLTHPHQTIEDFNEHNDISFFEYQIFPRRFSKEKGAWVPNYQSHLIGEGMISRKLAEWYDLHGYSYPYLMGIATTMAFQYTNEMLEMSPYKDISSDPVADIYIFNTAGYALFSLDPVANFFGNTLNLNCWFPQPVISPLDGTISNAGEQFIMKYRPPFSEKWQLFYSWGIDGTLGLTRNMSEGFNYSVGIGQKAFRLKQPFNNNTIVYPELEPHFVFFCDQNESLLLSFSQTGVKQINTTLNIYPGLVHSKLGLYLSYNDFTKFEAGITLLNFPVGLQY